MTDRPRVKTASPHAVKKAFGVHAASVIEVINSHADSIEAIVGQVEALTNTVKAQSDLIAALSGQLDQAQTPSTRPPIEIPQRRPRVIWPLSYLKEMWP